MLWGQMSFWGHWGQKMIFTKNDMVLFRKGPKGYFCERMGFREVRL